MTAAAEPSKQRWKRMQRGMTPWWLLSAPLAILVLTFGFASLGRERRAMMFALIVVLDTAKRGRR